jgi:hypothetical protein
MRSKNRDQTHRRAASKGRRGTLAVLEYERGAILSLRLSKVGRPSRNSQSFQRTWRLRKLEGRGELWWPVRIASLALTIAGGSGLLSHPTRNPDLDLLPHKNPQFLQPAATTDFDISIHADTPSKQARWVTPQVSVLVRDTPSLGVSGRRV